MSTGAGPNIASKTILVVANETLGGKELLDAVQERADSDTRFILCVPQNKPGAGLVIYDDAVFDAAQVRLDLALEVIHGMGIRAIGEVGDPDPFSATLDAVREFNPQEIIVSTYPATRSGWLRRDLIERVGDATGLPVTHVVNDIDSEGLPFHVTLAVANRTASGDELLEALQAKAEAFSQARPPPAVHHRRSGRGRAGLRGAARPYAAEAGARPPARPRAHTPPGWSAIRTRSPRSPTRCSTSGSTTS